jgi:hypothetical protein
MFPSSKANSMLNTASGATCYLKKTAG